MSKVLTFISESLFHLSNLDFLLIRQNLGWLPIRHEFEGVGTRHREGQKKSNTNVANHGECEMQSGCMSAMLWKEEVCFCFAPCFVFFAGKNGPKMTEEIFISPSH